MARSAASRDEQFRKILDNNIVSNHWLVQLVAPGMIERKDGAIIIVSSIGGLMGSPVIGAYNISKAADMQLARNLAVEHGRHGIRVNCIAPGLIKTDFAKALWDDPERLKATEAATPLRRIGDPDDIAGAAVFLASDAGRFMTGQTMVVDGGVTIAGAVLGVGVALGRHWHWLASASEVTQGPPHHLSSVAAGLLRLRLGARLRRGSPERLRRVKQRKAFRQLPARAATRPRPRGRVCGPGPRR